MTHNSIENLGKGAVRDRVDPRDFLADRAFAAPVVDWNNPLNGTRWQKIRFWRNQGSSSSCTGQATAYTKDVINGYPTDPASARSIYPFVRLPGGGAYIRDAVMRAISPGIAAQSQAPDPAINPTEQDYLKIDDITQTELESGKEKNAFVLPEKSIDWVAAFVNQYNAVVFGLEGTNKGWQNKENPKPPQSGEIIEWGHALSVVDYHLHNGVKCVMCASSWVYNNAQPKIHHIKENYFLAGYTFNPWAIIPKGIVRMLVFFKVKGIQTIWALIDGEWVGFADFPAFSGYINGRPNKIIELDQVEFDKLKSNPGLFKT